MKRREVFQAIAVGAIAAGPLAVTVAINPTREKTFGRLTVEGHRAHKRLTGEDLHVYLDGVDVTANCFEADDVEGFVHLYCRDPEQHRALDAKGARHISKSGGDACSLLIKGRVVIQPGDPL